MTVIIFDISKAETNKTINKSNNEIKIEYLESKKSLEEYIIDSGDGLFIEFKNKPRASTTNKEISKNPLDISYLDPNENLDNYVLGPNDTLAINFINRPKGSAFKDKNLDPNNINYLNPNGDLKNYYLDTGDSVNLNFIYVKELNGSFQIDREGEISLPEIGSVYVRGLNVYQVKKLLEDRYKEYLKLPDLDVTISSYRFINSGIFSIDEYGEIQLPIPNSSFNKNFYVEGLLIRELEDLLEKKYQEFGIFTEVNIRINEFKFIGSGVYPVDTEGEIFLPIIKETFVRGLTPDELSKLLDQKYKEFDISLETKIKIATFKSLRVLVGGEIRSPGVYLFPAYSSGIVNIVDRVDQEGKTQTFFDDNNSSMESNKSGTNENLVNNNSNSSSNSSLRGNTRENSNNTTITNSRLSINYQDNPQENFVSGNNIQNNDAKTSFLIRRPNNNVSTLANAIQAAGGITSSTDLSNIEIIRDIPLGKGGGKKRAIIDFKSYVENSDPTNDVRLFDGDRIFFSKLKKASEDQVPKSILAGLSPRFISVKIFGRVENAGVVQLPLEASLSDAIDLTGPIKPLSGKIVLIRYNKDGTILNKNISYSARAKKGSKRNPFVKQGDLISVKNSILGKSTGVIREFTAPFVGIYSTKEIIESFND